MLLQVAFTSQLNLAIMAGMIENKAMLQAVLDAVYDHCQNTILRKGSFADLLLKARDPITGQALPQAVHSILKDSSIVKAS